MSLVRFAVPIHQRLREQKLQTFFSSCDPQAEDSLLDIGGTPGFNGQFIRLHSFFRRATVVNLTLPSTPSPPNLDWIMTDGCVLPFRDASFDWVFSNAVLEHVGSWERQVAMANEIRRVARRGYFIATPNRDFPIDPHTFLPFYHVLPVSLQRRAVRFALGHMKQYEPLNMVSARQMHILFPGATILRTGMHTSIVAVFGNTCH